MTLFFRKLQAGHDFFDRCDDLSEVAFDSLPTWVIQEFVPRHADKGWLSCFASEDDEPSNLLTVSAALDVSSSSGSRTQYFMGVDESALKAANVRYRWSPGGTFHVAADRKHVELEIDSIRTLEQVVKLFLTGKPVQLPKAVVELNSTREIRNGKFAMQAAISRNGGTELWKSTLNGQIKAGNLWVVGADEGAGRLGLPDQNAA